MNHTPGPWHVEWNVNVFGANGRLIANTGGHRNNADGGAHILENEANAHLIAAAPLMYEYIKQKAKEGDEHAIEIVSTMQL